MTSKYRYGYLVEHRCRELLRQKGAIVTRSAGSKGIFDLVAIFPEIGEIWLVQCKKKEIRASQKTINRKFSKLAELRGTFFVRTFLFAKQEGKYKFIEVFPV